MGKMIIKYLATGNVSDDSYEVAKNDMYTNNLMMLRILSAISSALFLICTILGLFVSNMNSKITGYVIGLVISVTILLAAIWGNSRKLHTLCMYLFDIMLLSISLLLSIVSAPEQLTITLIPVALLVPLFFDTKPYKFVLLILVTDFVYLICAPVVKPSEILVLDMVDVLAFSVAGIVIGTVITKVKIERYVYAHEISKIALHDGLTDCFNRVAYNKYIQENKKNCPDNLAAIMIDVNGLKKVNDNIGHEAGDELITTVAQKMKLVFGAFGDCFRLGGDEFIALVKVDVEDVTVLIHSFRAILKENHGVLIKEISVAVGYAMGSNYENIEDMVSEADRNMYKEKIAHYQNKGFDRSKNMASDSVSRIATDLSEFVPGGYFVYEAQGNEELLYINNEMLNIFECTSKEQFMEHVKGNFRGVVHPDDLERVEQEIANQIQKHMDLDHTEYRIVTAKGNTKKIRDYGRYVSRANGTGIFYVMITPIE